MEAAMAASPMTDSGGLFGEKSCYPTPGVASLPWADVGCRVTPAHPTPDTPPDTRPPAAPDTRHGQPACGRPRGCGRRLHWGGGEGGQACACISEGCWDHPMDAACCLEGLQGTLSAFCTWCSLIEPPAAPAHTQNTFVYGIRIPSSLAQHLALLLPPPAGFGELLRERNRQPLLIGMSLMLFQQITGQPSVLYYAGAGPPAGWFVLPTGGGWYVGQPSELLRHRCRPPCWLGCAANCGCYGCRQPAVCAPSFLVAVLCCQ